MLKKQIIVNVNPGETRVAIVEKEHVAELFIERHRDRGLIGNIYKGVVSRVLPGIQSAFIDIGEDKAGFLYVADVVHEDVIRHFNERFSDGHDEIVPDEFEKRAKHQSLPIEKVLREGQEILVQVTKEPFNNKGARLTMFLTLPGRYLVLAPYFNHVGISKKITSPSDRDALRELIGTLKPDGVAVIARTASMQVSPQVLLGDLRMLCAQWSAIDVRHHEISGPALIHRDVDIIQRITRDQYSDEVDKIVIDDVGAYERLRKFIDAVIPGAQEKVEFYQGEKPIFDIYGIEMDIGRALSHKVDLPSGGHIVIDQTEALTAFDVNTGRFVGRQSARDTVLKTNLEAATKVVSELRLRNIGGIIVIDFIDMEDPTDRERVFNQLNEELKSDKARTNVLRVSELGLVQMTRKRTSESLEHVLMDECPLCSGRGKIKSVITEAYDVLRELIRTHIQTGKSMLLVKVREDIRDWILEEEREWFQEIVDKYGLTVNFRTGDLTVTALSETSFEVSAIS